MSEIQVVSQNLVVALQKRDFNKKIGKARRRAPGHDWVVSRLTPEGAWQAAGFICGAIPEVLQRKMVHAMLSEI